MVQTPVQISGEKCAISRRVRIPYAPLREALLTRGFSLSGAIGEAVTSVQIRRDWSAIGARSEHGRWPQVQPCTSTVHASCNRAARQYFGVRVDAPAFVVAELDRATRQFSRRRAALRGNGDGELVNASSNGAETDVESGHGFGTADEPVR